MVRKCLRSKDVLAGLLMLAFGGFVAIVGSSYDIGELRRIGPGFLPFALGILLCCIGFLTAINADLSDEIEIQNLWPSIFVIGGIIAYAITVRIFGLAPASAILALVSAFAHPKRSLLEIGLLLVIMPACTVAIFIYGLGLPISIMRWPF